jgi:hypothetical protein
MLANNLPSIPLVKPNQEVQPAYPKNVQFTLNTLRTLEPLKPPKMQVEPLQNPIPPP